MDEQVRILVKINESPKYRYPKYKVTDKTERTLQSLYATGEKAKPQSYIGWKH